MEIYNEIYAYESNKVTPFIYKTNDLGKFNNYEFNRDLDLGHVKMLANRIKDFTLCPLICTINKDDGKIFILDGQHRLEVAKRKNVPIYYRIIDNVNELDIAELQVKKNWSPLNWVKFWAYHGNSCYKTLLELHNAHGLTVNVLASLLHDVRLSEVSGLNGYSKSLASGKFKIRQELFARKILKQLQDFPGRVKKNTKFIKALIIVNKGIDANYSEYSHDTMKKRISQYPEKFEKKTSMYDYARMIEDIMNIGVTDKNRVRFF